MLPTDFQRLVRPFDPRNLLLFIPSFPHSIITEANPGRVRYKYSPSELRRLRTSFKHQPIEKTVFKQLKDCRILRPFRGCRAGRALKLRNHAASLNISTAQPRRHICISSSSRSLHSSHHLIPIGHAAVPESQNCREFCPSVALANMMSLSPKIDELRYFGNNNKPDIISMTETWVYDDTSPEHHLHLPGYNLCLKNRKSGIHGGVGLYINNTIKFRTLNDLYYPELEVLWVHLRPV